MEVCQRDSDESGDCWPTASFQRLLGSCVAVLLCCCAVKLLSRARKARLPTST